MTRHPDPDVLSAYLDGELDALEIRRVEDHLALCVSCRDRYEGLRSIASALRGLDRVAPPSTLDFAVTRRIALDDGMPGLLERLENGLDRLPRLHSTILGHFAILVALASMILVFADGIDHNLRGSIPVSFVDTPVAATPVDVEVPERPDLLPIDGVRYEPGIEPTTSIDERIVTGGERWREVLRIRPELVDLEQETQPAIVRVGSRVVAIHPSAVD